MLRLKPSEITLTSADVEETRRRMATRPPIPHGTRLRRGPMRSRNDAVATPSNVPVPRPQQAVHATVDDAEDKPASSPPTRHLQLPIRPKPTQQDQEAALLVADEDMAGGTPSSSNLHCTPLRRGFDRPSTSETIHAETPHRRIHPSTDGLVETAHLLATPVRVQTPSLHQQSGHDPSPSHIMQMTNPNRASGTDFGEAGLDVFSQMQTPGNARNTKDPMPPRFIRSYWDSHQKYRFAECVPQTEPGARTQRLRRRRTLSSSSEPCYQLQVQRKGQSNASRDDEFWSTPVPDPSALPDQEAVGHEAESSDEHYWSPMGSGDVRRFSETRATSGRHSSVTSNGSDPYSFYELPESRNSSNNHSQGENLDKFQYDGAASSRTVSRGAYYSIRLPQEQNPDNASLAPLPAPPSQESNPTLPDLSTASQPSVSPLPTHPYTRVLNAYRSLRPSLSLIGDSDLIGGNQDAAIAVQRDLSSPLNLIQERATACLHRISTRLQNSSSQESELSTARPQQVRHSEAFEHHRRPSSSSGSFQNYPSSSLYGRMSARARQQVHSVTQPPYAYPDQQPAYVRASQNYRMSTAMSRAGQRSSENAPVTIGARGESFHPFAQDYIPRRAPASQTDQHHSGPTFRSGHPIISPTPVRFSMPQVPRPRDVSNRPHMHSPHPLLASDDDLLGSDTLAPTQRQPPRSPPSPLGDVRGSHSPRQYDHYLHPQRGPIQLAGTPVPAPGVFIRQSERSLPSTSATLDVASGTTSRRSPISRITASRRHILDDQENSEERDRAEMSRERAAVLFRHGEEGQLDVMDETPPRMGRYERQMFN